MKNYKNYCISYFESGKDKNLYKILAFEDKLIDYLKNLSNPITVITNIFGIDFKKEKYIEHYFNFIEMKERRNLIVHRGGKSDEQYLKTIKKYLSKFPQKNLNNFLNELEKEKDQFLNIDQKYFLKTIETFYFLICLIVNKVLPKNDSNKKITLFTDPFNELFNFTLENKLELLLIPTAKQLFSIYISEDLGNDLSKMEDKSKVNLILCNQQLKEFSVYIADCAKKRGLENKKSTIVIQRFEEYNNHLLEKIEDKLIKKIIISFLEKNYHKFTESIFSYVERESIYPRQIESNWYMFKKLSLDDNFRKIYYPFKEKNNLKIEEIKVSLSKDVIAKIKKRKN